LRVGFVVPVFDDQAGAARAVASIRAGCPDAPVVVVDDASPSAIAIDGVTVVRHETNRGPGAARNTGVAALGDVVTEEVEVVVFVDSDVELDAGCIEILLAHLDAPEVTAVAPRIRAEVGERSIDRYEAKHSPLDLGPDAAVVRPGSPVPYLPSTVLAVRRTVFADAGGFDETMRVGEDVDLVWRLLDAGAFIRYEPAAIARHRNRPSWAALARQRFGYGTAAARLDRKHPGDVAPVEIPAPMLLAWSSAALGGPLGLGAGVAISANETRKLHANLGGDAVDTRVLSLLGHRHAAQWLAHAVRRAWLPLFLVAAPFSKRARRVLGASMLASVVFDDRRNVLAGFLDDSAYCAGVWRGALLTRSFRVLLPRTASRGGVT
jgi:mycofactocin system glycosyltransferase